MSDERLPQAVEIGEMLKGFVGSVRLGPEGFDRGVRLNLEPQRALLTPSLLLISPGQHDETGDQAGGE
jgi:hypothetical protein